jgi:hypothetical protein
MLESRAAASDRPIGRQANGSGYFATFAALSPLLATFVTRGREDTAAASQ